MSLPTQPYKGVRDFYPEDMAIQNYIFDTWRKVSQEFGYVEYGASILEPADLYRQKSGDEIVNDQMYVFEDKGGREVALRPEMTPTVARMVAAKHREYKKPMRWFSIPNLFRYERPQRGRMREHWQLNADIFGLEGIEAEIEIIRLAVGIMDAFGIKRDSYEIRLNSRKFLNGIALNLKLDEKTNFEMTKLLDKKEKMSEEKFEESAREILDEKYVDYMDRLSNPENYKTGTELLHKGVKEMLEVKSALENHRILNVTTRTSLARGFDYYTGIVFEIFDTHPDNNRSLFGGGRYDNLLEMFGKETMPAVGFGMGDITIRNVLETYNLLPPELQPNN